MDSAHRGYQSRATTVQRRERRRRREAALAAANERRREAVNEQRHAAACRESTPEQWPGYDERVTVPLFLLKPKTNDGLRLLLARKESELASGIECETLQEDIKSLRSVLH